MTSFDAAAATAHYLQTIDPVREARAVAYTHGAHWLMLWGWLAKIAADVVILRSKLLVRLRDRVQRAMPRPSMSAFLCVGAFVLLGWLLQLPWAVYAGWARERSYGLTSQGLGGWLLQEGVATVFTAVLLGSAAVPVYALMRRTGQRWWAWSGLVVSAFSFVAIVVAPVVLTPLFNDVRPAPAGPVRIAAEELARTAGIPAERIVLIDGSKQSNRYSATVAGGPGFATIQLSDTMLKGTVDVAQVRAVVAHEIGHYVRGHLLILSLVFALVATAGLWVVQKLLGSSRSFERRTPLIQDPSAVPALHVVFTTYLLLVSPLIFTAQRWVENDADIYGLALAREPDGAARSLVRTVDFRASAPTKIEEVLFYDHPSISNRIRRAMKWKAEHESRD